MEKTTKPTIRKLRNAAQSERWDYVDQQIPGVALDPHYVNWASTTALEDSRVNIRDLGASILTAARFGGEKFAQVRQKLGAQLKHDATNYAGFRAACALAEHGAGSYRQAALQVLQKFTTDKDVATIARRYLRKLN